MKLKFIFFSLFFTLLSMMQVFAQFNDFDDQTNKDNNSWKSEYPRVFLGVGHGINSVGLYAGIIDIVPADKIMIRASIGQGGWGEKITLGVTYLPKLPRGWGLGFRFSHSFGLNNYEAELKIEPNNTDQDLNMQLKPCNTADLLLSYNLCFRKKRLLRVELGYAIPLQSEPYDINMNYTLTKDSKAVMSILQPGGLSLGVSYSWGLKR